VTTKVRYAQPLLGVVQGSPTRYLVSVPGASVLIRQDGLACSVFADNAGTALSNPVPIGVAIGSAGVDTLGTLVVYLEAGNGYDAVATVGDASSTFAIPDISPDVADVLGPIPPGTYAADNAVVKLTGAQTIAGAKDFTTAPTVNGAAIGGTVPDATASVKGKLQLAGDLGGTAAVPTVPGLAARALDSAVVHNTGAETVAGVKTFSAAPVLPAGALPESAIANLTADLAARALDAAVIHTTGAETIAGVKTFSAGPVVPAAAFPESAVANLTTDLAAKLPLAGGTLTGALVLAADPTANLQAATKQYVDTGVASATIPDATASVKGKLQLAGDLGGTAALPSVPGLAGKLAAVGNATKSGGTLTVDATGSTTTVPLVVTSDPASTVDHLSIVGPSRGVGAGEYRVIVDRNMGLQTNAAISISTGLWTGTNKEIPAVLAGGRPYCFAADSDIVGPTVWLKGNGSPTSVHVEIQDQPGHKVVEIRQPTGVADGAWMSIGEEGPIATLTLSDKYEEPAGGAPVSFVMRHGRGTGAPASVRFKLPSTAELDISANSESGENALSEWALRFGHATQGVSFQTATAPGGTRTEMGRFVSNGLLLKAPTATSGIPDRTSPTLTFQDTYWNGSASVTRGFRAKDVALGSGPHALQFIVDETSTVCMAIGYTGQVGVGDPFVTNPGGTGQLHVVAVAAGNPALVTDTAASPTADIQKWRVGSTEFFAVDPAGLPKWTAAGNQQTTVGAAGGASALPATPTKYLKIKDSGGTTLVVPAYAA
jgi:hypothetical protein